MPETPTDHRLTTLGKVENLKTYKLKRRAARIVPQLLDPLSRDHVVQHLDDSGEVAVWREAGRMAGRRLGVHVRTGQTSCGCPDRTGEHVWVANLDAPAPEEGVGAAALNRLAALVDGPEHRGSVRSRPPWLRLVRQPPPAGPAEDGRIDRE